MSGEIRSPSNPRIKRLKKLFTDAGERRAEGLWAVEGVRLCEEAVAAGLKVAECYAEAGREGDRLSQLLATVAAPRFAVSRGVLREALDTVSPQGICILVEAPKWTEADFTGSGPLLALDRLRDPGNLGTLIRTAAAAGAKGIALTGESVDPGNPKALRASAGAAFRLPVLRIHSPADLVRLRPGPIYPTEVSGGAPPEALDLSVPFTLVLGQEAEGVGEGWAAVAAGRTITIPMATEVESINVAAAGAAILFEAARQRRAVGH